VERVRSAMAMVFALVASASVMMVFPEVLAPWSVLKRMVCIAMAMVFVLAVSVCVTVVFPERLASTSV
jgi:hypothetical protein